MLDMCGNYIMTFNETINRFKRLASVFLVDLASIFLVNKILVDEDEDEEKEPNKVFNEVICPDIFENYCNKLNSSTNSNETSILFKNIK